MVQLKNRKFIRDGRSPIPSNISVSNVMSANKAKNTKPEIVFRKELWSRGVKGYRLHWKKAPGRPDIAFPSKKIAVFVNGCFWHRCPACQPHMPKSNSTFWKEKFERNIIRDTNKIEALEKNGWNALIVWECEINRNPEKQAVQIKSFLKRKTGK